MEETEKEQGKQFILFWEISNEGARDSSDVTLALGHMECTVHSHLHVGKVQSTAELP